VQVVILIVVVLALAAIIGMTVWLTRTRPASRTTDAPSGDLAKSFSGDVMSRSAMTSGGLARLEFFDWGVRLHGTAISRWIVPSWEARYDELAIAELVKLRFSRIAVWLKLRGEAGGIGFLTNFSEEILRELAARDVPVNRAISEVRTAAELYARGPQ
jgi:hypothetical protein